jgi:hypothetical protein
MTQNVHLITYSNELYEKSKKRLLNEARNTNWFDSICGYSPKDLTDDFKITFGNILNYRQGAGFWSWKMHIILQELRKMRPNDILIYMDAGCSINPRAEKRFREYINLLNDSTESMISFQMKHSEKSYTTQELADVLDYPLNDEGQYMATIMIMKNIEKTHTIFNKCIEVLRKDPYLITNQYNNKQNELFLENRHDQSILSLMRKKLGSFVLPDETWYKSFENEGLKVPFWATRRRD